MTELEIKENGPNEQISARSHDESGSECSSSPEEASPTLQKKLTLREKIKLIKIER